MYDIATIFEPKTVEEAVAMLAQNPGSLVLSGGSDLLIKIREGKLAGCSLVSIHNLSALKGVTLESDGTIKIGPATSFSHITADPLIQAYLPMLGEAVDQVGGPQIRNIGTVGGNLCNGVTSADSASTLLAMDARLELTGPNGVRQIPLGQFYTGPGRTVRAPDELLTAIRVRKSDYEGFCGHYIKYAQRGAMDIATLGCAVWLRLDDGHEKIAALRLAFGVAAPTPIRCFAAERAAIGLSVDDSFDAVALAAVGEVSPRSSWRASKEFRLQLVEELSRRAIKAAIANAGGANGCKS